MLSLGWSELLIVAAVALIVVGPADLPGMLRNLGRVAGSIRRMGNEFRTELNKVAAVDDIQEARRSLTNPLRAASREISKEFNKIEGNKVSPTGAIKPKTEGSESVADEIREAAGVQRPAQSAAAATAAQSSAKTEKAAAKPANKPKTRAKSGAAKPSGSSRSSAKAASKTASRSASKPAASKSAGKSGTASKSARTPASSAKSTAAKSTAAKSTAAKSSTRKPASRRRAAPKTDG